MRGLFTAIKTLTIIPLPVEERSSFSSSLTWFPVVGFLIGALLAGIGLLWIKIFEINWSSGGALVILAIEIYLTGALHLDGLADWADALGGYKSREKRLSIMKDPHLGSFGVLALTVVVLAKWVALERLLSSGSVVWLLAVLALSRGMMVELISTLPYGRTEEGMATAFLESVTPRCRIISHTISICLCAGFGPAGFVLFGGAWVLTKFLGASFQRGFGGITGDLLGTTNELLETGLLGLCALPAKSLLDYTGWGWLMS